MVLLKPAGIWLENVIINAPPGHEISLATKNKII